MVEEKSKSSNRVRSTKIKVINTRNIKDLFAQTSKQIVNFILIGLMIISSFFIGYFYSDIEPVILNKKKNFNEIKNRNNTSISITEKGELMIIDRVDQRIEIYDDTVASIIFNSYSNRMISNPKK